MTTLADILLAPERRDVLIQRTTAWIERHVAERSGVRGLALRTGLSAARAARPDAVERAVSRLLPEFAAALEPFWQRFRATGQKDFSAYLRDHAGEASADVMERIDARIAQSPSRALHTGYKRLRGTVESELAELLPALAKMIGGIGR